MVQERLLWIDHHTSHHHTLPSHHPHPKTDLVCPLSPENGFDKDRHSPESSDSEDLHYGPGIVNKLRNKYLSLALRESNARPTILRKATSLEHLLDEEDGEEGGGKEEGRLFRRRGGGNDAGSHMNSRYRSSNRRQDMKRARSVEAISRTNHDEEMTMTSSVTAKINNRQSLHEEILVANNVEKGVVITDTKSYKKSTSIENGTEDTANKYTPRINRPKRIPPLLNEREKPPADVVKQAKLIFEKKPETRTKKPQHTGDVAAKVDSFNNIVKSKTAPKVTKPPIKNSKPVLNDKPKINTQHHVKPVAKPVILSEEISKPKSLDLKGSRKGKKDFNGLPSPIPDVSRVDIKNQDSSDPRNNSMTSLCETPDLILTSSPIPKITSPTYRIRSTESFIEEERNSSFLGHVDARNKYISPIHSPTKMYTKPSSLHFNKEDLDALGMKMISPISQKNITKNSATSVFNFINSQVDQNHLPPLTKTSPEQKTPVSEPLKIEVNGFNGSGKTKKGLSAFEIEKNHRNVIKSGMDGDKGRVKVEERKRSKVVRDAEKVGGKSKVSGDVSEIIDRKMVKTVGESSSAAVELGQDVVGTQDSDHFDKERRKLNHYGPKVEKTSSIFENYIKTGKNGDTANKISPTSSETSFISVEKPIKSVESSSVLEQSEKTLEKPTRTDINLVKPLRDVDKTETIDTNVVQTQIKSASSVKSSVVAGSSNGSEEIPVKVEAKKPKVRVEEATSAVFNFTARKDVPDYIANDKSRAPSRIVLPKPDEPGIKLLPEALLSNFKEIQDVLEEDELIRSLEARPPSPCDIAFINDNILIDGKSNILQRNANRVKLKISFVDDADIYEYPSENSLLIEDSPLPSPLGGAAQVGHTVPNFTGSSLATYTPKTTETFQLGITKTFHEPAATSKPDVTNVSDPSSDLILEEVDEPILFSSGSTSDILF